CNHPASNYSYTLSLHDALPICYFKKAYAKFGNWTLVAAAYNRGMAGIERQITAQGVTDYYDMYLNDETSRYVFRILAVKEIMTRSEEHTSELQSREKLVCRLLL